MITDLQFSRCTDRLLNIRRSGGIALNKPVLLLTLLDIIEVRSLTENLIVIDKEFEAILRRNWQQFTSNEYTSEAIKNPIFYLQNDGLWETFDKQKKQITGKRALSSLSIGKLNPELFNYCSSILYRPILRMFLLDSFFPKIKNPYDLPSYISDIENQIREGRQDVIRFVHRTFIGYVRYHKFRKILMEEYD
jgi:predicted restriction endonuclease